VRVRAGHDQVELRLEVAEERPGRDLGRRRDVLDRRVVVAVPLEQVERRADDGLAGARLLALAQAHGGVHDFLHRTSMPSVPPGTSLSDDIGVAIVTTLFLAFY
jgi:hypothetical protein